MMKLKRFVLFLAFLVLFSSFVSAVTNFTTDNVMWLQCDSGSITGSTIIDESGNQNGTITGNVTIAPDDSCAFDGNDEFVFSDNDIYEHTTGFTYLTWINTGLSTTSYIFGNKKLNVPSTGWNVAINANDYLEFVQKGTSQQNLAENLGSVLTGNNWTCLAMTMLYSSGATKIYVNGHSRFNKTDGSGFSNVNSLDLIVAGANDVVYANYEGYMDNVALYKNRIFTQSEITDYCSDRTLNPYVPPLIINFTITAISNWTGLAITNFSALINGTIYNTTDGVLETGLLNNDTNLFNITLFSDDYFNQTFLNYNVSTNLEGNFKQTQVNISFEFSNGDVVNYPVNLTSLDTGVFFNVTNGSEILFPDEGFNNFSVVSNTNIFSPFNFTLNLSVFDNSTFVFVVNETQNVITFLDENSSSPIDNASIIVNFPSGFTLNLSTNASGDINFSYIQNSSLEFGDYIYTFDKVGYILINLSDVINESNIPHTRTYNLSRAKLNIFIYDRVTRLLLNGTNVSVAFIGLFNETTDTGVIIKDNLTIVSGDYLIFAGAEGYKTSIRGLTFTNQEEFTLNFYLLNLSEPNAGTLFVSTKDSFFRDITGAKVDLLEYIPDSLSYVSVDSCVSNVNAQCSFAIELNIKVYYIRATMIIEDTVFVAETSRNGEVFTVDNDIRNLIFFTRSTFSISTSTNLIYSIDESFVNNVSSISVDFFTSDGTAKEVCIEYFILNGSDWVSVTGDTYCLFSSNAIQNIDVDVTLNRSNTYQARIYVKEDFDNVLKTYDYPDVSSAGNIFNNDFKAIIIMIFWLFALGYSMHQKNISIFFFLGIVISWSEVLLFPIFSIVAISVFKTIICLFSLYISRKKEDFQ